MTIFKFSTLFIYFLLLLFNCNSEGKVNGLEAVISKSDFKSKIKTQQPREGIYFLKDEECTLWLEINLINDEHVYAIYNAKNVIYKGELSLDSLEFKNEGLISLNDIEGIYDDERKIISIQNYGNSQNEYIHFKECDNKYLHFYLLSKTNEVDINKINVERLNDLSYYLEQSGHYEQATILLEKIIKQFPERVVAYLNLADAYWGLGNQEKAKENYRKYISMMKAQGKDLKKIPRRAYERSK
ncbi:MAG: tetratricopeptide repeat protein [Flavobacteriales bacterium]